ncbi:hypothetical protein TNCV_3003151 [Trichonephila clavipes]|nr:hypothetical protein TNCV_3003151 [Trichonephila clavipes]
MILRNVCRPSCIGILGEDMDVCKCIVPLRPKGTLNSRRVACRLVRYTKLDWYSKLRLTTDVDVAPCRDEFCGP